MGNQKVRVAVKKFKIKRLKDGRAMLNLACGYKIHPEWTNIDFSPLVKLARHKNLAGLLKRVGILSEKRYQRVLRVDTETILWDLRKGIPFGDKLFDVVYHSHFLEHLDKDAAYLFLRECYRVLKPCGVIRVVVPDLEIRCRNYLNTLEAAVGVEANEGDFYSSHEQSIRRLVGQMVRNEPAGTAEQPLLVRKIESFVRGDTAKAGEIHRWMYDSVTLRQLLLKSGFTDVSLESYSSGRIKDWLSFNLDSDDGDSYKRDSIYIEGVRGADL